MGTCSKCGAKLTDLSRDGLCPRCALGAGPSPSARSKGIQSTESDGSKLEANDATLKLPEASSPAPPAKPDQPPGGASAPERLGEYELLEEIARGGIGIVYKARDPTLSRTLALKVLALEGEPGTVSSTPLQRARFLEEAHVTAQLDHPSVIPVHDLGQGTQGEPYFTMKLVKGRELKEIFQLARANHQGWNLSRAVGVLVKVCQAVAYAHTKGVIHRDLKPSNIMVGRFGEVYVMDWGLAKVVGKQDLHDLRLRSAVEVTATIKSERHSAGSTTAESPLITMDGSVVGTPAYMPPEQAAGQVEAVDQASDIYSLGAILYNLLAGQAPYVEEWANLSPRTILARVLDGPPKRVHELNRQAPPELIAICEKAMAREKSRRYASSLDLAEDLQAFLDHRVVRAYRTGAVAELKSWVTRNKGLAAMGAAALLMLVVGAAGITWQWHRAERNAEAEKHQRERAESTVVRLEMQHADQLLLQGRSGAGLAQLARLLRQHPDNPVIAERLVWALSVRNFCLPVAAPVPRFTNWSEWAWSRFSDGGMIGYGDFSPDGRNLYVTAANGDIAILDTGTGQPSAPPLRHDQPVLWMDLSPNGQRLVTGSSNKTARIWDVQSGRVLQVLTHTQAVNFAAFAANGEKVVTCAGPQVQVWNSRTGERLLGPVTLPEFGGNPASTWLSAVSPEGDRLLYGPSFYQALMYDLNGQRLLPKAYSSQAGAIWWLQFGPDGTLAVSGGGSSLSHLWDAATVKPLVKPLQHDLSVRAGRFSPNGLRLATASMDETVRVWDARTGEPATERLRHEDNAFYARFSADGHRLFTLSSLICQWDLRHGQPLAVRLPETKDVVFSRDGQSVLTVFDERVQVRDARTGQPLTPPLGHRGVVNYCQFSPDGQRVVTGSRDGTARVWDARTGAPVTPLMSHLSAVSSARFSADGQWVVTTASRQRVAQVWSAQTGEPRGPPLRHEFRVYTADFSPNGRQVLTASGNAAYIWDVERGVQVLGPLRHSSTLDNARFSRDGACVVTISFDGGASVWNARTGQPLFATIRHEESITSLHLSLDGTRAMTVSRNSALIWELRTGRLVTAPLIHSARLYGGVFSPDGRKVALTSVDHTVRLWDIASAMPVSEPLPHRERVVNADFSPDGRWLATGCQVDGQARIWELLEAPTPAPTWLSDLAEAVAGQRYGAQDAPEKVSPVELWRLREKLTSQEGTNFYARWAKWFFAPSATRTLSVSSSMTVPEYVQRCLEEGTQESLREAVSLIPTDALAMARLAEAVAAQHSDGTPRDALEAEWLSRHATNLAPENPAVLAARAETLGRLGRVAEGLQTGTDAMRAHSSSPELGWVRGSLLEQTNQLGEACQAYGQALALMGTNADYARLRAAVLGRYEPLLRRLNRTTEANTAYAQWLETELLSAAQCQTNVEYYLYAAPREERNVDRALLQARRAFTLDPGNPWSTRALGVACYLTGRLQEAVEVLQEPNLPHAESYLWTRWSGRRWFVLALCHQKLGQPDKARSCYDQALEWKKSAMANASGIFDRSLQSLQAETEQALGLSPSR